MARKERGLYESLVTEALDAQLVALDEGLLARRSGLHEAEAADRIALHLGRVIVRALDSVDKRVAPRPSAQRASSHFDDDFCRRRRRLQRTVGQRLGATERWIGTCNGRRDVAIFSRVRDNC